MKKNLRTVLMVAVVFCIAGAVQAATIDLTGVAPDGSVTAGDGSIWQVIGPQSAGTGVFEPFVRIQANGTESGYNTDAKAPPLDAKAGTWTHSMLFSQFIPQQIGGSYYYEFRLDVNQSSAVENSLLSLDTFQIWSGNVGDKDTNTLAGTGFTKLYDLYGIAPVLIDYNIFKGGEGIADVAVYIPTSLVNDPSAEPYLYLFSAFGGATAGGKDWSSNDGPEYWGVRSGTVVPVPPSLLLLAPGLLGLIGLRRRFVK
jgi:hypothetical protein